MCSSAKTILLHILAFSISKNAECGTFQNATVTCVLYAETTASRWTTTTDLADDLREACAEEETDEEAHVIVGGSVPKLRKNSVAEMRNLLELNVSRVGVREIEPGAFRDVPRLHTLHLDRNELEEIKSGTFENLNVSLLDLRDNLISRLEVGAFRNLPKLQALDLEKNKLGEVGKGVFDNISIWILDLSNNDISKLEEGIFANIRAGKDKFGVVVWLQNNKLEVINCRIFNNSALRWLDLSNNSISVIHQGDLSNVPHLESLRLSGNNLETIPEGVFNGSKLRALYLSANKISAVASSAFDNMRHLHRIDMSHNKLKIWDSGWFTGSTISLVSVAHNCIELIPDGAFKNLSGVKIDLSGNKVACSEELKSMQDLTVDNCTREKL